MKGENNHKYGKNSLAETKALMSNVKSSDNNPMYGNNHSSETLAKMSKAKGGNIIYVYNPDKSLLVNSFPSARKVVNSLIVLMIL